MRNWITGAIAAAVMLLIAAPAAALDTVFTLFTNQSVSTGTPFEHTLTNAESTPARSFGFSQAVLYVNVHDFTATPTLQVKVENVVFGDELLIMDKAATATSGVTTVFMIGISGALNEGEYGNVRDSDAVLEPGAKITFTVSGAGAAMQIDAELRWKQSHR